MINRVHRLVNLRPLTLKALSTALGMNDLGPIVCISDVHGNLELLRKAISKGLSLAARETLPTDIILLGDLCDNGPHVPGLLEWLSTERWREEFPHINLRSIIGNHDLACLLSVNPAAFNADPNYRPQGRDWYTRWSSSFANPGGLTRDQYGASSQEEFMKAFPVHHYRYLESLPWYIAAEQYVFVHAGFKPSAEDTIEEQMKYLDRKDLSDLSGHVYRGGGYGIPDHISNKDWSRTNDPDWGIVVVTGHNKYAAGYRDDSPDFEASHRIGFHSCACAISLNRALPLHCALLHRGPKGSTVQDFPPTYFGVTY